MKIYFYLNDFHKELNRLNINYKKINLSNNDIVKFLKIYHNNIKLNLPNTDTVKNFMKNYPNDCQNLLIQLENYNNIIELRNILSNDYTDIYVLEEEQLFVNKSTLLTNLHMKINNMIVLERIENITEKPSVFDKLLKLKIDNIYCLTYKNSRDNKNKILAQVNKMNSSIEFVNIKDEETYNSDKLDLYKYCVSNAKSNNYENIIIMTEDNEFNYNNFFKYLNNKDLKIPDFDLLFLSGKLFDGEMYNDYLIQVKTIQDTSCFVINSGLYEYIIENINKEWNTLDIWNNLSNIEKQINWKKKIFENFLTKFVCQKRNKSYFTSPLLSYKGDSIDNENRIVVYKDIMEKLCVLNSLKYRIPFDVFVISEEKNVRDILLFQRHNVFSNFNIFQKIKDYDFNSADSKLSLFNLYPLKTDMESHKYDVNVMKDFLNHYFLWEYFASRPENTLHFILTDTIDMVSDFKYKLNDILKSLSNNTELIILNNQSYSSGYLISNNGCKKIMQYLNANSVQTNVDNFLKLFTSLLNTYKVDNNLIIFNYKIEKSNLLGQMDEINKKLNPNIVEKYVDNIKDDKIIDSEKFRDRISDNQYKEVIIEENTFYKNSKGLLFKFYRNILEYYGYIEDNKVIVHSLHKSLFGLNLNKNTINKETIIFYQEKEEVPYYLRKLLDLLSLKYNVVFIGKNFYNLKLNNVIYIRNTDDDLMVKIKNLYNVKIFYTNTFNLLFKISKTEDMTFNYLYHIFDPTINCDTKIYKNNGIELMKNTYDKFDNIYFFNKDKMEEFKNTLNLDKIPENFKLNGLALNKNENKIKLGQKKNIIVSFDKHPKKVINSFKLINTKLQNKFKLILLNDDITYPDEDIVVVKFSDYALLKYLNEAFFFITFENDEDTYFHILNAINSYCIPIIPRYFGEFTNKFVGINNFINKHNLDDIKEIYTNEKKKIIYNNLCDSIIKNHVNNMNY